MCDVGTIYKAEYEDLRQEIRMHQVTASGILAAELATLGIGVSASGKYPYALLVVAMLTSILWLRYIESVEAIFRAALYVALVLRPRVTSIVGMPVLEWEIFLRQLRAKKIKQGSGKVGAEPAERFQEKVLGLSHTALLFIFVPPILLAVSVTSLPVTSVNEVYLIWLTGSLVAILWIFSMTRFRNSARRISAMDHKISSSSKGVNF